MDRNNIDAHSTTYHDYCNLIFMALNLGRQNNIVMDQDFREARNNSLTRSVLRELRDVLLEGLGHHGLRPGQVLGADLAPLEPQAEPHPLEDLHVVVDLEGVVEVEEVLVLGNEWANRVQFIQVTRDSSHFFNLISH